MIRKRNKLFSKQNASHLPELNERYKSLKRDVHKKIRKSHQQYINSFISSEDENGTFSSRIRNSGHTLNILRQCQHPTAPPK